MRRGRMSQIRLTFQVRDNRPSPARGCLARRMLPPAPVHTSRSWSGCVPIWRGTGPAASGRPPGVTGRRPCVTGRSQPCVRLRSCGADRWCSANCWDRTSGLCLRTGTAGIEPAASRLTSERSPTELRPLGPPPADQVARAGVEPAVSSSSGSRDDRFSTAQGDFLPAARHEPQVAPTIDRLGRSSQTPAPLTGLSSPADLSVPLSHPSSLDPEPVAARRWSCVEGCWSPGPHGRLGRAGPFSLGRGLDHIWVFFKLGITFLCWWNERGRPLGRPRQVGFVSASRARSRTSGRGLGGSDHDRARASSTRRPPARAGPGTTWCCVATESSGESPPSKVGQVSPEIKGDLRKVRPALACARDDGERLTDTFKKASRERRERESAASRPRDRGAGGRSAAAPGPPGRPGRRSPDAA
jgi:hypothetical protein